MERYFCICGNQLTLVNHEDISGCYRHYHLLCDKCHTKLDMQVDFDCHVVNKWWTIKHQALVNYINSVVEKTKLCGGC